MPEQNHLPTTQSQPVADNTTLTADELAKLKLPKLSDIGGTPDASKTASFTDLSTLGIPSPKDAKLEEVLVSKKQIEQQQPASRFATELIDTNRDGKITRGEFSEFAYRADQFGNRDGKMSIAEYNVLFAHGAKQFILEQGKAAGLDPKSLSLLEGRLASGQFGVSGERGLPDAFDIGQASRSPELQALKTMAFLKSFEAASLEVPIDKRTELAKEVLGKLAETGVALAFIGKNDAGNPVFAADSLKVTPGKNNTTEYRFHSQEFELSLKTGKFTSVSEQTAKQPLTVVDPAQYKFKPNETNPFLKSMTESATLSLQKNPDLKEALKILNRDFNTAISDPQKLEKLLKPLHSAIESALNPPLKTPLKVEVLDRDNPQSLGSYRHPQPGTDLKPELSINIRPRMERANREFAAAVRSGVDREKALNDSFRNLKNGIIETLLEENFHALQHQTIDQHQKDPQKIPEANRGRVADYTLNRSAMIDPQDLEAFFGSAALYEQQPLEADAKQFRKEIRAILDTLGK
jgi:hypothetical protein